MPFEKFTISRELFSKRHLRKSALYDIIIVWFCALFFYRKGIIAHIYFHATLV